MAGREVNFDIVAKDKASDVLDDVAKEAAKVEKLDPTVDVKADSSDAKHTLDGMTDQLDKLTDADKIVVLALRAGAAKAELTDLATDLATIDSSSPDVDVKFDRYAEVSGQLDQLETKMRDIADTSIDPDVDGKAKARFADVSNEAGKAGDAVHSMAGNAIGDFAATTTGIGPLGEAIGQLTEGIANAEVDFKQLATAGLSMGAVAVAMWEVQQAMAKMDARKAFDKAQVDAFSKALGDGATAAEALRDTLAAAGKIEAPNIASWGNPFADATSNVTEHVAKLGLTLDQFNALVEDYAKNAGAAGSLTREWGAAQREAGADGEDMVAVMNAIATAAGNLNKAEDAQAANAKVFGDTAKQVGLFNDATQEMRNKLVGADKAAGGLAVTLGTAAGKTKALESAYQSLSDQVSNDQAMLDLADQIDAVTDAGNAAIQAQKDANAAIKQNASDATEKQREAEAAMRDYQSAVNATKTDIINLAASAHANPIELKAALDKVDQGDLNGAKADAEAWSRRNPVVLTAELRVALIKALGSGLGPAIVVPGSAPTTNVTNFIAVPDARRQAQQAQRTARVNGRR